MSRRTTVILIAAVTLFVVAVGAVTSSSHAAQDTSPLVDDLDRAWERGLGPGGKLPDLAVDAADALQIHIPIGMEVEAAKDLLNGAGFVLKDASANRVPVGRDQVVLGLLVSPRGRTPFSHHSFNVVLEVSSGVVVSAACWVQHTAL